MSKIFFDSMSHLLRGYHFRAIERVGVIIHFAPIGYAFFFLKTQSRSCDEFTKW